MEQHEEAGAGLNPYITKLEQENYHALKRLDELERWAYEANQYLEWLAQNGYYTADVLRAKYTTMTLGTPPNEPLQQSS